MYRVARPSHRPRLTGARAAANPLLHRAARSATVGVLVWTAAAALGIPALAGVAPNDVFAIAGVVGAIIGALGGERVVRAAAATLALMLVLVTSLPLIAHVAPDTVRRDRPTADSGAVVDAIAVLSSGVGDDGTVEGEGVDRLLDGLSLAKRTGRPLIVSIVHPRHVPGVSSLADQRRIAALAGLGDRLWTVDSVGSTHDEAVRMAALAHAHGWRRVALVTSPAHTRRACATFERAGLAVVCTPATARDAAWGGPTPLRSPGDRLRVTASWIYEQIGWQVYRRRGWV
ncbi:MAG TPA: YdcF family protein [Gemmatirosa sp.]